MWIQNFYGSVKSFISIVQFLQMMVELHHVCFRKKKTSLVEDKEMFDVRSHNQDLQWIVHVSNSLTTMSN